MTGPGRVIGADELVASLPRRVDGSPRPVPTDEQRAVIEAPPGRPRLVVAGAGSGKTETMALRVVWLVANGHVRPEQVLGLTFTRKAAGELGDRLRRHLRSLARVGAIDPHLVAEGEPTVLTYDAFAGRVVADHGLRIGAEPAARLVTQAQRWQIASGVVAGWAGSLDLGKDPAPATVVERILDLHDALAGHLVEPEQVARHAADLRQRVEGIPCGASGSVYATVRDALTVQDDRVALLPLVAAFAAAKQRGAVPYRDFADQARLAARVAAAVREVGEAARETYRVVVLDEYQDTSPGQLVLLRALFGGGHDVTAVGDPCQAVYGWRGASAGALESYPAAFPDRAGGPAERVALTRSWRNQARVLDVANALAEPLRAGGFDVPVLRPPSPPAPGPGRVVVALHLTAEDEAQHVAEALAGERRRHHPGDAGDPPEGSWTAAVLVRNRNQIPRVDAALRAAGLDVEIVGVGGLLAVPEVVDLVAALQVLADPTRGDALMRLVTGARWRLGPRDVTALGRWAAQLAEARQRGAAAPAGEPDRGAEPDEVERRSLVDALDDLPGPGWFSPVGAARLRALRGLLRGLRGRMHVSLPELVADVEATLALGVEVQARRGPAGRADLDRFLDVAHEFTDSSVAGGDAATLPAFLAYLDAAREQEWGLRRAGVEPNPDRVQILTVHGAKGLEWDAVAVVGLADKIFPNASAKDRSWLSRPTELPYDLRGDGGSLPVLDLAGAADQRDVRDAVERFHADCLDASVLEERRLAYVAVTRARSLLLCSSFRWDHTKTPREPGPFLLEMRAVPGVEVPVWATDPGAVNPRAPAAPASWPYDPLGQRRPQVEAAAGLVRAGLRARRPAHRPSSPWAEEVDLLLEERRRSRDRRGQTVLLPGHLSVSDLVLLGQHPQRLARRLRRPVPLPPAPQARRGTRFHAWLEARWGVAPLLDIDELPGWADAGGAADAHLAELQECFEASPWAARRPVEVESAFELPLDGVLLRGRVDAVFAAPDGTLVVVDWKTGRLPGSAREEAERAVQLAVYRLAFARLRSLPVDQVQAALHYVRDNVTLRPADLLDEPGLVALIQRVPMLE